MEGTEEHRALSVFVSVMLTGSRKLLFACSIAAACDSRFLTGVRRFGMTVFLGAFLGRTEVVPFPVEASLEKHESPGYRPGLYGRDTDAVCEASLG